MEPRDFTLRVMEALGVRLLYAALSKVFRSKLLPLSSAKLAYGFDSQELSGIAKDAQYFGKSNFGRLILNLPVLLILLLSGGIFVFWFVAVQCLIHLLVGCAELYRSRLAAILPADPDAQVTKRSTEPLKGRWFEPKSWESSRLYKKIGVDWFRVIVHGYIDRARLTKEERKTGQAIGYLQNPTRRQAVEFEAETRLGELVHYGIALLDSVPFIYGLVTANVPLIIFTAYLFVGDIYLSLLQRYHRLRLWKFVQRERSDSTKAS